MLSAIAATAATAIALLHRRRTAAGQRTVTDELLEKIKQVALPAEGEHRRRTSHPRKSFVWRIEKFLQNAESHQGKYITELSAAAAAVALVATTPSVLLVAGGADAAPPPPPPPLSERFSTPSWQKKELIIASKLIINNAFFSHI